MKRAAGQADRRVERAVLALLLTLGRGGEMTVEELFAEIGERAETLRALDRLETVGLVHRNDGKVKPTPAARRFDKLDI